MTLLEKRCPRCKGTGKVRNILLPGRHPCRRCNGRGEVLTILGRTWTEIERRIRQSLEERFGIDETEEL